MILGVTSSVEGEHKLRQSTGMWLSHLAGGALGGTAVAFAIWLILTPFRTIGPTAARFIIFTIAVVLAAGIDAVGLVPASRRGRQVPATWLARYGPLRAYAAYGALLGGGILTFVPYAVAYVVFIGPALLGSMSVAIIAGAVFGSARAALVGPGALVPALASRVLFRAKLGHQIYPKVSLALLAALWFACLSVLAH